MSSIIFASSISNLTDAVAAMTLLLTMIVALVPFTVGKVFLLLR